MTYYEVLEISEFASEEVIRMAYKALAKKFHPDIFNGDRSYAEEKMKEINEAYSILIDVDKRTKYDEFLKNKRTNQNYRQEEPKEANYNSDNKKSNYANLVIIVAVFIVIISLVVPLFKTTDIETVKDSVVMIKAFDANNNLIATGSGFCAFESNYIVTNYHVIEGAYKIDYITDDGMAHTISDILIFSAGEDLAVLKGMHELEPISIGNTSKIKAGDKVTAIGSPERELNTVSTGVISNADDDYQIRITAPISPGSSGGVLLNEKNKVIGITYATYDSDNAQNINYAINVNYLNAIYDRFIEDNYVLIAETDDMVTFSEYMSQKVHEITLYEYYRPETLETFYYRTNPYEKYVKLLKISSSQWFKIFEGFSNDEKQQAYELYLDLEKKNFNSNNISAMAESWNKADFFVNLNIFDVAEYSVLEIDMKDCRSNSDIVDTVDGYDVDYAVRLLIWYLSGDYYFDDLSDDQQEEIFDYFDENYNEMFSDIYDMGAVLELLGYEVEYIDSDYLRAYW